MKSEQCIKIRIPLDLKNKVVQSASERTMYTSAYIRFILYNSIKLNHIMTSIPTMKSDTYLKFKVPIEMYMQVKVQAELSNLSISGYIRALLHNNFNESRLSI